MAPENTYADERRAAAYARLGVTGTYYLAYRDLPMLIGEDGRGRRALDFGCGAGRSTRFLRDLGFDVVGIDVSPAMLEQARRADPEGKYLQIEDDAATGWPDGPFDLALAAFPFDAIADEAHRVALLTAIRERLAPDGRFVLIASAPELYTNEWATLTTAPFREENAGSTRGGVVRVVIKEGGDSRPIEDRLWRDEDYRAALAEAGFEILRLHRPLGRPDEPYGWVSELEISPWLIYLCKPR